MKQKIILTMIAVVLLTGCLFVPGGRGRGPGPGPGVIVAPPPVVIVP